MGRRKPPEPVARAGCDKCGPVRIPFSALIVRVCVETRDAEYRFLCPGCAQIQVTAIHPSMLPMMLSQLLEVEWWFLPRELMEPHDHPPITSDDCLDFMRELESM